MGGGRLAGLRPFKRRALRSPASSQEESKNVIFNQVSWSCTCEPVPVLFTPCWLGRLRAPKCRHLSPAQGLRGPLPSRPRVCVKEGRVQPPKAAASRRAAALEPVGGPGGSCPRIKSGQSFFSLLGEDVSRPQPSTPLTSKAAINEAPRRIPLPPFMPRLGGGALQGRGAANAL